jgi:chitodextrinase
VAAVIRAGRPRGGADLALALLALLVLGALALLAVATDRARSATGPVTVRAVADSYVDAGNPSVNFGTKTSIRADGSPVMRSYLRFDVKGLTSPVARAVLRVRSVGSSTGGYQVRGVADTGWGEAVIQYANAPAVGDAVGASGAFDSATWTEVDVTSLVSGNGLVSMALTTEGTTAMTLSSRESGTTTAPQLVVTTGAGGGDTTAPAAPSALSAFADGQDAIALAWTAPPDGDVVGYGVYRDGAAAPIASTSGPAHTETGLAPGSTHSYRVDAVDAAGNRSAKSTARTATTLSDDTGDTTAPSVPTGLAASAAGSSAIDLTWSAATDDVGVASYGIYRDGGSTRIATTSATSFSDSALAAGSTHSYRVDAADAAGNRSAKSTQASATTSSGGGGGSDPVIAAAGDIACGKSYVGPYCDSWQTSELIRALDPDHVLVLGDIQYEKGEYADYIDASSNREIGFGKSWGRFKDRTYPTLGNHEYLLPFKDGYLRYWSDLAAKRGPYADVEGFPEKGWYSFDLGAWHVISFNTNCVYIPCGKGSDQEKWLKADLAANSHRCTLVFGHHPNRNSFFEPDKEPRWPVLFQLFYDAGVDLALVGHAHDYERMAPIDPAGKVNRERGIRQFVVGTGGRGLTKPAGPPKAFSEVNGVKSFGVLELTLRSTGYAWTFHSTPDTPLVVDTGSASCH